MEAVKNEIVALPVNLSRVSVAEKQAEASQNYRKEVSEVAKAGIRRFAGKPLCETISAIWEAMASYGDDGPAASSAVFGSGVDWVALVALANRKRQIAGNDPATDSDVKMDALRKLRGMVAEIHRKKDGKAGYDVLVKELTALGQPGKAKRIAQTRFLEQMDNLGGVPKLRKPAKSEIDDLLDLF